jgi:hypothetical protein
VNRKMLSKIVILWAIMHAKHCHIAERPITHSLIEQYQLTLIYIYIQ